MAVVNGAGRRHRTGKGLRWLVPIGVMAAGYAATTVAPVGASAASAPVVKEAKVGKLGTILVNAKGRTLYLYTPDTATKVACTGGCLVSWPPLTLPKGTTKAVGTAGVTGLSTIKAGGKLQVEYKGHPLYTFIGDTKAGATTGQGKDGTWFVLKPGSTKPAAATAKKPTSKKPTSKKPTTKKPAAKTPPPTAASSGAGY